MRWEFRLNAVPLLYVAIIVSLGAGVRERLSLNSALSEVAALRERNLHLAVFRTALLKHLS